MAVQDYATRFSETAVGVATATAIHAADASKTFYITEVSASADLANLSAASLIVVKQGSTTIWQDVMPHTGTGVAVYMKTFYAPLAAAKGASVSVAVGTALTISTANIAGYEL